MGESRFWKQKLLYKKNNELAIYQFEEEGQSGCFPESIRLRRQLENEIK